MAVRRRRRHGPEDRDPKIENQGSCTALHKVVDTSCDPDLDRAKPQNPVSGLRLRLPTRVRPYRSQPASKSGRGFVPSRGSCRIEIPKGEVREYRVCCRSGLERKASPAPTESGFMHSRQRHTAGQNPCFGEARSKEGWGSGFQAGESRFAFRGLSAPEIFNYAGIQGIQISYEKLICP